MRKESRHPSRFPKSIWERRIPTMGTFAFQWLPGKDVWDALLLVVEVAIVLAKLKILLSS